MTPLYPRPRTPTPAAYPRGPTGTPRAPLRLRLTALRSARVPPVDSGHKPLNTNSTRGQF